MRALPLSSRASPPSRREEATHPFSESQPCSLFLLGLAETENPSPPKSLPPASKRSRGQRQLCPMEGQTDGKESLHFFIWTRCSSPGSVLGSCPRAAAVWRAQSSSFSLLFRPTQDECVQLVQGFDLDLRSLASLQLHTCKCAYVTPWVGHITLDRIHLLEPEAIAGWRTLLGIRPDLG